MHVVVDQRIDRPASAAQACLLDPALYEALGRVSPIGSPEMLADEWSGSMVTQRLRLRFTGRIDPPASRFVDADRLTWVQETVTDLARRRTELRTVPDRYRWLLSFEGWYELRDDRAGTCVWHFEADLRVNLPGLGRPAERGIARGLREHLAATAALIEVRVDGG